MTDGPRSFAFGSVLMRLEGDEELLARLPDTWTAFRGAPAAPAHRCDLRLTHAKEELPAENGWTVQPDAGGGWAVYAAHGRNLFALRQDECSRETAVRVWETGEKNVRVALQFGLLLALRGACLGLHGVTLRCGRETVILSAPSGTGKTTLAQMLAEDRRVQVINGDFALLSCGKDKPVFEPTPFCGTSRICGNVRLPVDRIVFLSQAEKNRWSGLSGREALTLAMNNVFVPVWDGALRQAVLSSVLRMLNGVRAEGYAFAEEPEAARGFLNHVNL